MPSETKVTLQKEEMLEEEEGPETPPDSPLLDRSNASVKALVRTAKKHGYVTHDQINSLMREVNSEQIENVLAMFSEMGITPATSGPNAPGAIWLGNGGYKAPRWWG
jgi:RNA polymerase primary sigma factor